MSEAKHSAPPAGQLPPRTTASDKTLLVLSAALRHPRLTDIVGATGLSKTSVHRIIQTLLKHEYLAQASDATYYPGPESLRLISTAFRRIDISTLAAPYAAALAEKIGAQVHVGARNGNEAIYILVEESSAPYRIASEVGDRLNLGTTAMGKCFLAADPQALARYIDGTGLHPRTPKSITDPGLFHEELNRVRERGYAIDDEENVPGVRCIGAPIADYRGAVTHCLSVSTLAMEHSVEQLEEIAPEVISTAGAISAALGGAA